MGKNAQLKIEGTDTELSKLCDNLLEARTALEESRASMHEAEAALIKSMQASGKKSIKHDGRVIRFVHQDAKDKIQIQTAE